MNSFASVIMIQDRSESRPSLFLVTVGISIASAASLDLVFLLRLVLSLIFRYPKSWLGALTSYEISYERRKNNSDRQTFNARGGRCQRNRHYDRVV
jgi:hypothetical protein